MPRPTGLTDQQKLFAAEYVACMCAGEAAKRAGYSPKTANSTGSQLLARVEVKAEVDRLMGQKTARAAIKGDQVLEQLAWIATASMAQVAEWGTEVITDPDGNRIEAAFLRAFDSKTLPPAVVAAIAEIKIGRDGTATVKMHDKLAAIDKLMRHLGLYQEDNSQKADGLAQLIALAQGTTLGVTTGKARTIEIAPEGDDE